MYQNKYAKNDYFYWHLQYKQTRSGVREGGVAYIYIYRERERARARKKERERERDKERERERE